MRATIKIIGIGSRRAGISKKSGKAYDFVPVSFALENPDFNGYEAATSLVDGGMLDASGGIQVNQEREAFFHRYNNSIVIDGIL